MSGSRWQVLERPIFLFVRSSTIEPYAPFNLSYVVGVGIRVGIGNENGRSSMIGLGTPPAALSNPFLLNITLTLITSLSERLSKQKSFRQCGAIWSELYDAVCGCFRRNWHLYCLRARLRALNDPRIFLSSLAIEG